MKLLNGLIDRIGNCPEISKFVNQRIDSPNPSDKFILEAALLKSIPIN